MDPAVTGAGGSGEAGDGGEGKEDGGRRDEDGGEGGRGRGGDAGQEGCVLHSRVHRALHSPENRDREGRNRKGTRSSCS